MDLALIVEDTASSASANRALVSLKTMQDAKWLAGDVLEVVIDEEDTSARRVALLVAWPSVLVAPSAIHVSRRALLHWTNLDGTSVPRRVRCTVVAASAVVEAKSVTVDVANNVDALADMMDLDDTALITLVRDTLRDMRYITASSPSFSVSYMAQKLQLRIDECIPSSTRFLEQSPLLHLGTAMKDLKLNDGADASCSATTQNFYHITRDTSVLLSPAFRGRRKEVAAKSTSARQQHGEATTYGSIGGLQREIAAVREIVDLPLTQPEVYTRFGLMPPKGVLLFGPPGTGKTLIAKAVANETGAHVITINGAEVMSKFYGETENKLRDIFADAVNSAPAIIFIDEIDALCPKRDESQNDMEKRIVATMLTLMDGVGEKHGEPNRVVVIGATNRPHALDPALRRPGRFDKEIEIGIPSAAARREILGVLIANGNHTLTSDDLDTISAATHGFVGADMASLCREAALFAIKRSVRAVGAEEDSTKPVTQHLFITADDFHSALVIVKPSTMREVTISVASTGWDDIGGQAETKQRLQEAILWPLQHAAAFTKLGIAPPRGILLYGPPGCSKTMMARAVATTSGLNFLAVKGPDVFRKYVGESERMMKEVFRKARAASPCVVFLDEVDALAVRRGGMGGGDENGTGGGASVAERVLTQLLVELDGIEPLMDVTIIAATNRPDVLDPALLRPGRIDRILYVGPPDLAARRDIFQIRTRKMPLASDVDVDCLATLTDGMSGAEVAAVCQEAAMLAMEEDPQNVEAVCMDHFERAIRAAIPRITPEMLRFYESFGRSFQNGSRG